MGSSWERFVADAIDGVPDDPYTRLLREKLEDGSRIVRVNFVNSDGMGKTPEYLLILEHEKHLSEMKIPHSDSLVRFMRQNRIRMETVEEEVQRAATLLHERFDAISSEFGDDSFESVLLHEVRHLAPPNASRKISNTLAEKDGMDERWERARRDVRHVVVDLLRFLADDLGYEPVRSGDILDRALAMYLDERFHISMTRMPLDR